MVHPVLLFRANDLGFGATAAQAPGWRGFAAVACGVPARKRDRFSEFQKGPAPVRGTGAEVCLVYRIRRRNLVHQASEAQELSQGQLSLKTLSSGTVSRFQLISPECPRGDIAVL